ncbi:MAG: ABC transporter permease [Actinomycetaceae bacterium]|nr:ABC transporter permease [Actinomycetaceae bacterium]
MDNVLSALVEAWEELRINKNRIILSLIGVGAAVWAMATVLALGTIISSSFEFFSSLYSGRPGTVSVVVNRMVDSGADETGLEDSNTFTDPSAPLNSDQGNVGEVDYRDLQVNEDGSLNDPFSAAVMQVVEKTGSNYWTRTRYFNAEVQAPEYDPCYVSMDEFTECTDSPPSFQAVDPGYFTIYYKQLLHGRLLTAADGQLQMNPVVVNEAMWQALGKPNPEEFPRMRLRQHQNVVLTVVGVVRNATTWDSAEIYLPYDSVLASFPASVVGGGETTYAFIAPRGEEKHAGQVVADTLRGLLGPGYEATANFNERVDEGQQQQNTIVTAVISTIGGIVILLGALGLLTVSIVTIQQRVREIGIRRAMGASARRVFISVFLESVVATTVAGMVGVMLSILTIRFMPSGWMDLPVSTSTIAYPLSAAFLGVLIAAAVGALCGIIPAYYAVRIKPIDAIRY